MAGVERLVGELIYNNIQYNNTVKMHCVHMRTLSKNRLKYFKKKELESLNHAVC